MWREFLAAGVTVACAAALVAALGRERSAERPVVNSLARGALDVLLVGGAVLLGISLEHPAALNHPALCALGGVSVATAQVVILAACALLVGALALLIPRARQRRDAHGRGRRRRRAGRVSMAARRPGPARARARPWTRA